MKFLQLEILNLASLDKQGGEVINFEEGALGESTIFSIVGPALLDIAFGKPGARLAVDGRLGGVKAAHIGEGGSSPLEISLLELRAAHQHPCFP